MRLAIFISVGRYATDFAVLGGGAGGTVTITVTTVTVTITAPA